MDIALPPAAPTRRRLCSVLLSVSDGGERDRWYAELCHMGRVDEWIHDAHWWGIGSPTPEVVSEVETALVAPLEAALMTRWGLSAVLL